MGFVNSKLDSERGKPQTPNPNPLLTPAFDVLFNAIPGEFYRVIISSYTSINNYKFYTHPHVRVCLFRSSIIQNYNTKLVAVLKRRGI